MDFKRQLEAHPQFKTFLFIYETLLVHGYKTYLAGGAVRDILIGRVPKDLDIASSAPAEEVVRLFPKTVSVGISFGIVVVVHDQISIEVARFRKDGHYADGRRPESVEFSDEVEDALRRDFTINALFYDYKNNLVIDYVEGQKDLQGQLIKTVGAPEQRFKEDYLRILRALRFYSELNFAIEEKTMAAVRAELQGLRKISNERMQMEFIKLLKGQSSYQALSLLNQIGFFEIYWPKVDWTSKNFNSFKIFNHFNDLEVLFLWLKEMSGVSDFESHTKVLKISSALSKKLKVMFELSELLQNPSSSWADWRLLLNKDGSSDWLNVAKKMNWINSEFLTKLVQRAPLPVPFLTGDDLLVLQMEPKKIGEALKEIYKLQLEDKIVSKEEALIVLRSKYLA